MVEINVAEQEKIILNLKSIEEAYKHLEELAKKGLGHAELSALMEKAGAAFKAAPELVNEYSKALIDVKNSITSFIGSSKDIASAMEFVENMTNKGAQALDTFRNRMGDSSLTAAQFGAKVASISPWAVSLQQLPRYMETVGASAKTTQGQLADLMKDDAFAGKAAEALQKALKVDFISKDQLTKWAEFYDLQRNLETGMMRTAAAGGNLDGFLKKAGKNFENLSDISTDYTEQITVMATATGMNTKQTADFQQKLDLLPKTYNNISGATEIAGNGQKDLVAAMQLARGAGLDSNAVIEDMVFLSKKLGKDGQGALSFIQRLGSVTQATGLPLDETRDAVKAMTEEFASMGDNTDAAINILGRLSPALREAGAAPAQTIRIFKDLTSSMKSMSTAQAAFLSASTGGPSGLQGAFKIKNMIRAGKTDEVMSKMQENLRSKFGGGPIVTSEQAEQSPEKAAQYQRQQMLMMSPAMGGMAKDEDSARYLIDAMAKNDLKGFAAGMTGSTVAEKDTALQSTMDAGNKLIQKGNSFLESMAKDLDRISGNTAAAMSDAMPVVDDLARQATGFKTKRQETQDAARLIGAGGTSASAIVGDTTIKAKTNDIYKRIVSSEAEEQWGGGDPLKALGTVFKSGVLPEVGFRNRPEMPFFGEESEVGGAESSRQAVTPDQRTSKVLRRADEAKVTRQEKREPVSQEVKVNVQTICMACNQKMTDDAIKNALQHQHGSNNSKAQTGAGR